MAKNLTYLWCHSQKNKTQKQKFFFIADCKTCQVFWGFEQLCSAIRWAMQLVRQPKYPRFFPDFQYNIFVHWQPRCWHFESRRTIYLYLDFSVKTAVFSCHTNAIAPLPFALESCSMAQTDWPVFYIALKKIFLAGGWGFFVSDVISEVVLGSFWLVLPGVGPNC